MDTKSVDRLRENVKKLVSKQIHSVQSMAKMIKLDTIFHLMFSEQNKTTYYTNIQKCQL